MLFRSILADAQAKAESLIEDAQIQTTEPVSYTHLHIPKGMVEKGLERESDDVIVGEYP